MRDVLRMGTTAKRDDPDLAARPHDAPARVVRRDPIPRVAASIRPGGTGRIAPDHSRTNGARDDMDPGVNDGRGRTGRDTHSPPNRVNVHLGVKGSQFKSCQLDRSALTCLLRSEPSFVRPAPVLFLG